MSNLRKSGNLQCGHTQGRIGRWQQFTVTKITVPHVDAGKVIFREADYVLPVE